MAFNAFSVPANTVQTTRVDMDENDTLSVASTGRLSVSANAQSVRFNAPTAGAAITNDGIIENTAAGGRAIRFETAVGATLTATIENGAGNATATIDSVDDAVQIQARAFTAGLLTVNNSGIIHSTSGQGLDFGGATGSLGIAITNRAGGQIIGDVSEAIRIGTTGATLTNSGTIAGGNNSGYSTSVDGIQFEDNSSGSVTNNNGGSISGDRHGVDAGVGSNISVMNAAGGVIVGRNGSGVGSDGSGSVTNYGRITGSVTDNPATDANSPGAPGVPDGIPDGDGDGVDMDGTLTLINFGRIEGLGASGVGGDGLPNTSDGVAAGGGTIDNRTGGVIISTDRGILIDNGSQGNSFALTNIVNNGTIEGTGGIGIRLVSTFDDGITNSGTITGGNGTAILFGSGNNTLKLLSSSVIQGLTDAEGGTDTLDYSDWGSSGVTVNFSSGLASGTGGVANFENVRGGTGADVLIGGTSANSLFGGNGDDALYGGDGSDSLIGGSGADILDGGSGYDQVLYTGSTQGVIADLFTPSTSNTGDAAGDIYTGIEGLGGSEFADLLIGGASSTLNGFGGDDNLVGGSLDDALFGNNGNDNLYGSAGADRLDGGVGFDAARYDNASAGVTAVLINAGFNVGDAASDVYVGIEAVVGSQFNDTLIGDNGNNLIAGQGGNDFLDGYAGNDTLFGGAGADIFSFKAGSGNDVVADFAPQGSAHDTILIGSDVNGSGIVDYASLQSHLTQTGADVLIDLGSSNSVLLQNVQLAQLTAGDFAFG